MAANALGVHTSGGGAFPLGIMSPLKRSATEGFSGAASASSTLMPSIHDAASCDTASITLDIDERNAAASMSLLRGGSSLGGTDQRKTMQQEHPLPMTSPPTAMALLMTHGSGINNFTSQLEQEAGMTGSSKGKDYLTPMLGFGSYPSAGTLVQMSSQSEPTTLKEFPFIFDGYSGWVCRHCSHLDYYYRGQNYYMQGAKPPPNDFVDEHLRVCSALNRSWSNNLGSMTMIDQGGQYRQTPIQHPREEEEVAQYATTEEGKKPSGGRQDAQTGKSSTRGRKRAAGELSPPDITMETYTKALSLLQKRADKVPRPSSVDDVGSTVVQEEDLTLLTDYFYYIALQLTVCRFNEEDRRARGGKRKNIHIDFGGLQCSHCSSTQARKFFWSSVDRLANSFAEIPAHVMKCKDCPVEVKDALLVLKSRHAAQMALLPRGSQKVFLRRMWRRLHDGDAKEARATTNPVHSHSGLLEHAGELKPPPESRSALISPKKRAPVLLAMPQDEDWLSDLDCFIRKQVEIFSASETDVKNAEEDQKYPITLGQVGLRCLHCAKLPGEARDDTLFFYPCSISGIYESVKELQRCHLNECPNLPLELKRERSKLIGGASSLSSVLRRYYVQAAKALGLYDSEDGGVRAGGTATPLTEAGISGSVAGKQETHFLKSSEGRYEEEKSAKKAMS